MAPDLTSEAWAQIRYDYEHTDRPIADICAEHGISDGTLRDRMRRWNWTRRRSAIPREGPPAITPHVEMTTPNAWPLGARWSLCSGQPKAGPECGDERGELPQQTELPLTPTPAPQGGGEQAESAGPIVPSHDADAEADTAAIVPRLQSAVARVLPAIEALIAKLAAEAQRPREMEQTARALGTLMRTLRELNALLREHPLRAGDDDPVPVDIDEFRFELARRINAFVASRRAEKGEEDAASFSVRPRESEDPGAKDSEQAAAGFPLARE